MAYGRWCIRCDDTAGRLGYLRKHPRRGPVRDRPVESTATDLTNGVTTYRRERDTNAGQGPGGLHRGLSGGLTVTVPAQYLGDPVVGRPVPVDEPSGALVERLGAHLPPQ